MKTKIVNPSQTNLVAKSLIKGECVAFKTDTIFGLSCIATNKDACKKLVELKNRENKPLIVLLKHKDDLQKYVKNIPSKLQKIINYFWPGPLTIIFDLNFPFCDEITCGKKTIAIRVPNHGITQKILNLVKEPIVSTSANLSGMPSLNTSKDIFAVFNGKIPYIINDENCSQKEVSSTIICLENNSIKILREGTIKKEDILAII